MAGVISIIGSRDADKTSYNIAEEYAYNLSMMGYNIGCGLARGVDAYVLLGWLRSKKFGAGSKLYLFLPWQGYNQHILDLLLKRYQSTDKDIIKYTQDKVNSKSPQAFYYRNLLLSQSSEVVIIIHVLLNSGTSHQLTINPKKVLIHQRLQDLEESEYIYNMFIRNGARSFNSFLDLINILYLNKILPPQPSIQ